MAGTKAVAVSEATFEAEVLNSPVPVVVDFWAPWCGPCKMIAPVIEELAGTFEGRVKILKMDIDENPGIPGRYGVRSIPTLIFFRGGKVVSSVVGAKPRSELVKLVNELTGV